ncbi:MAG TPA: MFS transporter [Gemmatimonadales bacterium]|nr:MFS transporter [Gemmatimonadales bacterium]
MPAPRASPFGALRHRNFRLFFFGQGTSLVGTWMQIVAQGWLVLELTNSPFYVGLVSALGSLPIMLVSLPAGVFVDRVNKRRLVVLTQTLSLLQALVLAILIWTHRIALWQVAAIAVFLGTVNAFDTPARQAFVIEMVGREDLGTAIALNSSAFNAARVVGPSLAGILIGAVGLGWCYFLNAVSYVAVIWGLLKMRLAPFVRPDHSGDGWAQFREGARFVRRDRRVLALVGMMAVVSVFGFPFLVLMPVFARDVLRVGPSGLGFMSASVGVGAVIAALGLAMFGPRVGKGRILMWTGPIYGAALVSFAAAPAFALALPALALAGAAMILNNAVTNTLLQTIVPDALRGRVMGFYAFVFLGMAPFGAFQAGWLAEHLGAPMAVAVGGLVCGLSSLVIWRRVPEVPLLK